MVLKTALKFSSSLIVCICFFTVIIQAQNCFPVFKKTYGATGNDEARDILYTADRGSILVGQTTSNTAGDYDAFILKLNEQGLILWSNQFGGSAHDQLVRIKSTLDGGYIAIGNSRSYGTGNKEVILLKLDINGNTLWARRFGKNVIDITAKEVIELSDGDIVFCANENDSTAQSNGILYKLDPLGNFKWIKTFDNGNDDGLNYIMEDGPNLYVTGYAYADFRDAVLMQLDKLSGNVQYTKKFTIKAGNYDEALNIYKIQNGIAFAVQTFDRDPLVVNSLRLTFFKIRNDGSVFYERKIGFGAVDSKTKVTVITTNDSGFVFTKYDNSIAGFSTTQFVGPSGASEWNKSLFSFNETSKIEAVAKNGIDGFLYTGFLNSNTAGSKNKIAVFKSNINGNVANCTDGNSFITDSSHYLIENFIWNNISSANNIINNSFSPAMFNAGFSANILCSDTECMNSPPIPPGCNSTFFMNYKSDRSLRAWDITGTTDGGHAIVGSYSDYNNEPLITKLKPNGDIQWSKTLVEFGHIGFFTRVLTATDGNLIVLGYDNLNLNHGSTITSVIMKVSSNNGQVIWSKSFMGYPGDMVKTDNGGYVITINEGWGGGSPRPYLLRLDASGNIVWQREIYQFGGGPVYRNLIFKAPFIYMAADMYIANPNFVRILKLDATTGNKVWVKNYTVNGQSARLQNLHLIGDTLFVGIAMPADPNKMYNGMICLDMDGNAFRSFKLTEPQLSNLAFTFTGSWGPYYPYNLMKTGDNNFMVADQAIGAVQNSVTITKYNTLGQILSSRNYPTLSNHLVTAIKEINGSPVILGTKFLSVVSNSLRHHLFLMKTDNKGIVSPAGTGECFSEPWPASTIPISVSLLNSNADSVINTTQIGMRNFDAYNRPINTWATLACAVPSECTSVEILGSASTCSFADTLNYTIQRNPGCVLPVSWETDAATTNVISFTDTTIRLHYIKNGPTYLIAHLTTGCGDFADTLFMNVRRNADSLSLGPDTTICERNTIILKAGTGFLSYLWQNASTADSLIVNAPGLYFVQVTDSCGNTATDSINVTPHAPVFISIGPNREKCNNDSLQLTATSGFLNYLWSPNYNISSLVTQTVGVNPAVDTTYFIAAEKTPGCFAFDTVKIRVLNSPLINLGNDTSFCKNQSITFNAGAGFINYLWNTGSTAAQITANSVGMYSVTATDFQGCQSKDSINILNIFELPIVNLNKNTELCRGASKIFDAGSFASYFWQDGSVRRTFTATVTGKYFVAVTDINGCKGSDTAIINTILPLPENFLPGDSAICKTETISIQPVQSFSSYLWSTNSTATSINITQPGLYWLQVTDSKNCTGRDSILVINKHCFKGIYVPNAFTPNGDNKNDILRATVYGTPVSFDFRIYNRYGQLVFYTKDVGEGWDGTYKGTKQPAGAYMWVCKYQFPDRFENIESGTSVIIR